MSRVGDWGLVPATGGDTQYANPTDCHARHPPAIGSAGALFALAGAGRVAAVALNGPEQQAFQSLVTDLDREDPEWMTRMGALAPRRTRRVRLARVVVAVWCFVALVALPVSESGLAAALAATVLALTGAQHRQREQHLLAGACAFGPFFGGLAVPAAITLLRADLRRLAHA